MRSAVAQGVPPTRTPSFYDAAHMAENSDDDGRPRKRFRSARPDRIGRARASSDNAGLKLGEATHPFGSSWPPTPAASPVFGPRTLPNELPESTEVRSHAHDSADWQVICAPAPRALVLSPLVNAPAALSSSWGATSLHWSHACVVALSDQADRAA